MTNTRSACSTSSSVIVAVPAADGAGQANAAGLMAVVAAIVDVVGAVQPGEQLQQKAGLVRAAAAEVPERLVGRQRL